MLSETILTEEIVIGGADNRTWNSVRPQYVVENDASAAHEQHRRVEIERARTQWAQGGGSGGGKVMSNGLPELIATGGGGRRYWDDEQQDYISDEGQEFRRRGHR